MNEGANPYDELTALFVTGPDEPRDRPTPTIELVVVGSLPVRASLWLGPYVEAISRDSGALPETKNRSFPPSRARTDA